MIFDYPLPQRDRLRAEMATARAGTSAITNVRYCIVSRWRHRLSRVSYPAAGTITLWTPEPRTSGSNYEDLNLLIRMGNLDPGHLPRPSQTDQLRVVLGDCVIRHPAKLSPISSPLERRLIHPLAPNLSSLADPLESLKRLLSYARRVCWCSRTTGLPGGRAAWEHRGQRPVADAQEGRPIRRVAMPPAREHRNQRTPWRAPPSVHSAAERSQANRGAATSSHPSSVRATQRGGRAGKANRIRFRGALVRTHRPRHQRGISRSCP